MFRHVTARAATVGLLALVTTSAAWAGPGAPAPVDDTPLRRVETRAPGAVDHELFTIRELVYQHLQGLGIPADDLRAALIRIDGLAQQQTVDGDLLARTADLALDLEGSEKALSILRAYAELATFGRPITENLAVNGHEVIQAYAPVRDAMEDGENGVVEEPEQRATPKIGGICLTCPNTDFGPFTPTPVWQTHSNSLATGTDCAWYSFNVTAGFHYTFKTCGPEGSAAWDTVLELYDTTCGAFIARNDQGCSPGSNASILQYDATYTGLVYLKVRPFSTTAPGPYTLAYITTGIICETCVSPDPVPLAPPTATCQCVSNTTTSACPSDYYQVSLVAGETYEFTTCPLNCAAATATFDTILRIWEPVGCTSAGFNDDLCALAGSTTRSTLTYTPVLSGIYKIQVGGRLFTSGAISFGSYTMCYRRTSAACATCATGPYQLPANTAPTPICQNHTSAVTACQDNWYDFLLTAGQTYEFTTCSTGTCAAGAASFDTVLDLYDGCAPLVATDDNGCGIRSTLVYPVTTTGTYRLHVRGSASATGSYTLTYRSIGACTPPSSVSVSPASGAVSPGTCCRTETFSVSVDASASGPVTYSWTTSPDGGAGVVVSPGGGGAPANFSTTLCGAGVHVVSVTATNACGNVSTNQPYTLLDTQVPSLTVPPDASVPCNAVPPPGPAVATDNCTASPNVTFAEVRVNGPCPDTYELRRTWTATDASLNATSRTQVIQVSDTSAPTLVGVPADATVECNAVPTPPGVTATDNCDPAPSVTFSEATVAGSCPGNYVVQRTWTARDRCNNVSSMTQVLTVVDTQPPNVVPSATQLACLWPPNHQFACFGNDQLGLIATDDCSGPVTWQITAVNSSSAAMQPCGDGGPNHDPDVILSDDGFCVRAERCGQENQTTGGRVYTVQAVATDACGNASAPTNVGTVFVPHDMRGGIACQRADMRVGN